ncbi:MAG: DUF308 domain-containing protein [bacterium]
MKEFFKKYWNRTGRNYLIACLLYLVIGFIFVLIPKDRISDVVFVAGAALIAGGIFMLLMGFTAAKRSESWPLGAVLVVFAIWLMVCHEFVKNHLYLLLGLAVLIGGVIDLYHYIRIRYTYGEPEILTILVSGISAILGVVILFRPFADKGKMLLFAGVVFLGRGVLSFLYYRRLQEMN